MTVAVLLGLAVLAVPAFRLPRLDRGGDGEQTEQVLSFLEMTALGVSSGMAFPQAAELAAGHVGGRVGSRARRMLRTGSFEGADPVARAFRAAGRAGASGAPLLPTLDGHIAELQARDRAERLEAIRKLPVKLLFPLALLVLPGFLLLTVGPVVAGSLQRLGF